MAFDRYYSRVSLLLPFEGANNSTVFTDRSPVTKTVSRFGDTKILTDQSKWGRGSAYFDQVGDYLSIPSTNSFLLYEDFTIRFWIYIPNVIQKTYATILATGHTVFTSGCGWVMLGSDRIIRLAYNFGGVITNAAIAASALPQEAWQHIEIGRSGTSVRLFINGVQSGSTGSSSIPIDFSILGTRIGANGWDGVNGYLNGYLQDFEITNGICRHTATFTPPDALWLKKTISGNATKIVGSAADMVVIRDWTTHELAGVSTTAINGDWSIDLDIGQYDISYFVADCQPICFGPYTVS